MLKIPSKIEYVIDTLCENGFEAYIVGGCVRDMLMGKEPNDFDVTTSAEPNEVQAIFPKTVPTGIKHGTVTVIADKTPIEVTTFRTEGSYTDHRRPDSVVFVKNLKDDLARRDFTVNAMAYNKNSGVVDYFGGKQDLNIGILRTVGNPLERFNEDALRILRLFRFASVLDFEIESKTLVAALKLLPELETVSRERIYTELSKAVTGKNVNVLSLLIENEGLKFLKISKLPDFEAIKRCNSFNTAFFTFLYLSSEDAESTLGMLKPSNALKLYFSDMCSLLSLPLPETSIEIKRLLSKFSPTVLEDYFKIYAAIHNENTNSASQLLSEIITNNEPYLISHLAIDGGILKKSGFSGREIGEKLDFLLKRVIENPELNTEKELKKILQFN